MKRVKRVLAKQVEYGLPHDLRKAGNILDICRVSLCCEAPCTVATIYRSLSTCSLAKGDSFEMVRYKNGFHPEYDAKPAYGYRDIKVNVLFDCGVVTSNTREPLRMICEIQLIWAPHLKVKKSQHGLYKILRGDIDMHLCRRALGTIDIGGQTRHDWS